MLTIVFCIAAVQCGILGALIWVGRKLIHARQEEGQQLLFIPEQQWPKVAMIVPVGGQNPHIASALTSLLTQDYPEYIPVFVTETDDEYAAQCIRNLQRDFPEIRHVVAGRAKKCGQKNYNTLAGIAAVSGENVAAYAFCDSTHLAKPDFLRCLLRPLAQGKSDFSTGYHSVEHFDEQWVTLAYCASVQLMRLLQGLSRFTQPWGGAMAIRCTAFVRERIGELWSNTVVDDCSLAATLFQRRISVSLCAAALLKTVAKQHNVSTWHDWMERQILFLKFCIPAQWKLLGVLVVCMTVPPLFTCLAFLGGLLGIGTGAAVALGLSWLAVFWFELSCIRQFLEKNCSQIRFLGAFLLACTMFARVYIESIRAQSIVWQGREYHVGENGQLNKPV